MAIANLTAARLRELLLYDVATGIFTWRKRPSKGKVQIGDVAGTIRDGYVLIGIDGADFRAHRLAWLYVHGEWPPFDVDHRDTVKHHNWIENLRLATRGENHQNQRKSRGQSTSGMLGVSWCATRRKWVAKLKVDKRVVHYTRHETAEAAQMAYLKAKARFHPFQTLVDATENVA
jgi:hypothetical protein